MCADQLSNGTGRALSWHRNSSTPMPSSPATADVFTIMSLRYPLTAHCRNLKSLGLWLCLLTDGACGALPRRKVQHAHAARAGDGKGPAVRAPAGQPPGGGARAVAEAAAVQVRHAVPLQVQHPCAMPAIG